MPKFYQISGFVFGLLLLVVRPLAAQKAQVTPPKRNTREVDSLRRVLAHFHARALPTALICHAPVALLAAQNEAAAYQNTLQSGGTPTAQDFLYSGYTATVFSTPEEKDTESGFEAPMLYYPADALSAAGMTIQNGAKWSSNVTRDRELITGQNPMSDEEFVTVLLTALQESPAAVEA